jgi:hypothetical protein
MAGMRVVPETLPPGCELPYAWDEPMHSHTLLVVARPRGSSSMEYDRIESSRPLDIDRLPSQRIRPLTIKGATSRRAVDSSTQDIKARVEGAISQGMQRQVPRPPPPVPTRFRFVEGYR